MNLNTSTSISPVSASSNYSASNLPTKKQQSELVSSWNVVKVRRISRNSELISSWASTASSSVAAGQQSSVVPSSWKLKHDGHLIIYNEAYHESRLNCSKCTKTFSGKYHLKRHMLSVHSTERPFACACGKTFNRHDSLVSHKKVHY